ncbi:MAG: SRPBCC family protein [Chitinophagaceae bacterium]
MEAEKRQIITVHNTIKAPVEKVWRFWTEPDHIQQWNFASDDWHTPWATSDLRPGGKFTLRMEAKDGSFGFDFSGIYNEMKVNRFLKYTIEDGREVSVTFAPDGNITHVTETFEAEDMHTLEMQQSGWQAILDNFKKYTEGN